MRPGLPRTSSINFQRSAAPPDFDRSQAGLLRLRCLCCLSIQGCSPPSQALQKFCEPGTAGRGDSPAFQIALEVKERISYFHRRRGRNARVCVRNMPGLKFMPCTKNKTGLFSEQTEAESAGSNPFANQLLYATEEISRAITPDADKSRSCTGLRIPPVERLARKESGTAAEVCFLPPDSSGASGGIEPRCENGISQNGGQILILTRGPVL